jgi:hypothetical protein
MADSATLHQVADDKTAGQHKLLPGVYRDPETGDVYQLNTGWHIVPRQSRGGTAALAKTNTLYQTWTDASGQIESRIYECITPSAAQHQSLACQVEPGFVAMGGGAYVDYGTGPGALLWENHIADEGDGYSNFITWVASSKDHIEANAHILHVYVIGIRLKDASGNYIDRSVLANMLHLHKTTSSPAAHQPSLTPYVQYKSVSTGARTNWSGSGCLLTATGSYSPNAFSYTYAIGKDHINSDPSTITSYSIDFDYTGYDWVYIPNFGRLEFTTNQCNSGSVSSGVAVGYCDVDPGNVLFGMGGQSVWTSGSGRMLFGIRPTGTYYGQEAVYSKDHINPSAGYSHIWLMEGQKI